jgi:hypothetical protein
MNFYNNLGDDEKGDKKVQFPTEQEMYRLLFAPEEDLTKEELRNAILGFVAATGYWYTRASLHKILNPLFFLAGFLLGYWVT